MSFIPKKNAQRVVGFISSPSLHNDLKNEIKTFSIRYSNQIAQAVLNPKFLPIHLLSPVTNTLYGHTALFAYNDKKFEHVVGWDPESLEKILSDAPNGFTKMPPRNGLWNDDYGLSGDDFCMYWQCEVTNEQYENFKNFIIHLVGRQDFGSLEAAAGLVYKYSFKPGDDMKQSSILENSKLKQTDLNMVANCTDAAFHVLSSFLYEWKKTAEVTDLKNFINKEGHHNLSQGRLIKWLSQSSKVPKSKL